MPVIVDFCFSQGDDGYINLSMAPPQPLGGATIQFLVTNRAGGVSGLIQKNLASGYSNYVSGISITNSGEGIISIQLNALDTSGFHYGAYFHKTKRTDPGANASLSEGHLLLGP